MMNNNFPDINQAIEGANSVNEICTNYINILNSTGNLFHHIYANKLMEYLEIDEKIPLFEDEFHIFKKFLREWTQKNKVNIFIKTRKKDFIGFNEKIRLHYPDTDGINDLIGFRLILKTFEKDTIESVRLCYQLLNDLIEFFVIQRKCLFLKANDLRNIGNPNIPNIIIPSVNSILKGFEDKVKDYIKNPKKTGYQSLHCCIQTPSNLVFEVQIRTFAMDLRDDHQMYKNVKYSDSHIDLDYSNISIPGIAFDENNELLFDNSGLLKGSDIFNNI